MPRNNGKGVTAEIDISPVNSDFTKNDFDWRVSSALITSGSDFSIFPGFDRWLTVIDGAGLKLNSQILKFSEFFYFRGEDTIACELLAGTVEDFGVIFNRDRFNCSVQLKEIVKEETMAS